MLAHVFPNMWPSLLEKGAQNWTSKLSKANVILYIWNEIEGKIGLRSKNRTGQKERKQKERSTLFAEFDMNSEF